MEQTYELDDDAVRKAMAQAEGMPLSEVVNQALREFTSRRTRKRGLELEGNASWEGNLDDLRKRDPAND